MVRLPNQMRTFPRVIDSTMLAALQCHRRWDWSYEQNLSPHAGKSIDLMAGAAFAKGAEIMRLCYLQGHASMVVHQPAQKPFEVSFSARPGDPEDALEAGIQALIYAYDPSTPDMGSPKTCDRMCGALEYYSNQFPLDDPQWGTIPTIAGRPGVEWNFCVPLPAAHPTTGEPLLFAGRTDLILDIYGGRYLEDDKTTKALGPSWPKQWDQRGQFVGYAWAARQTGLEISGTLVRGIAILVRSYSHAQALVDQPQWKCDEWLEGTVAKLETAKYYFKHGINVPALGEPCNEYGGCEFKKYCLVKDHQGWLDDECVERNWNPLERH